MKILKRGKFPVHKCDSCGCRFQILKKDMRKIRTMRGDECGWKEISCPECRAAVEIKGSWWDDIPNF